MYSVHIIPAFTSVVNFFTADFVFDTGHAKYCALFGVTYFLFNYYYVKILDHRPIYWFLTW